MDDVQEPDIGRLVVVAQSIGIKLFNQEVEASEAAELLQDILHGQRDLWGGVTEGLVTPREAATALVDRVHAWLMDKLGRSWEDEGGCDGDEFISEMEQAMFGALWTPPD